jgi:TPR repeat protein
MAEALQRAESGDAEAMIALGLTICRTAKSQDDLDEGCEWFLRASEHGRADALLLLVDFVGASGRFHDHSAEEWLKVAARHGEPQAALRLGDALRSKNRTAAEEWYSVAFKGYSSLLTSTRIAEAHYQLGILLLHGDGVAVDRAAAIAYLTRASESNHPVYSVQAERVLSGLVRVH